MKVEQIYTGCLAQGAYYIESDGEVAIIDPLREIQPYLDRVKKDNATVKYIFETHFHADFVSGHINLSKATGAPIVFGPFADPSFDTVIATDEQEFTIGKLVIKAIHTPGHTLESTCYLLHDENRKEYAIFSGDTLFLGDVGRPDLAQKAADTTAEDLAAMLFDSLRQKIMPLNNDLIIYPAHGAGSACGKNMMKETVDTLGNQRNVNYALRADMTKAEFIKEVTHGLLPPPKYFPLNVQMNREGYEDVNAVIKRGTTALSPNIFEKMVNETDALVLDVRHQDEYSKGHIPRSIFIGLDGSFAPWVGALIADTAQTILLVVSKGREEEAITRLSRVGFDRAMGYLEGSFEAWKSANKEYDTVDGISALALYNSKKDKALPIFDVRKETEYETGHIAHVKNTPLDFLNDHMPHFPTKETFYVHCAGGYRSVIAASILKSRGIHNFMDITGGYAALEKSGFQLNSKTP